MEQQKRLLKHIIDDNRTDIIHQINPEWFTDEINMELWKAVSSVHKQTDMSSESIMTHIQTDSYNERYRPVIISRLKDILSRDYIVPGDIVQRLENEYNFTQLNTLNMALNNPDSTLESKMTIMSQIYKKVTAQGDLRDMHNMNEEIESYLSDVEAGVPDILQQRSILLNSMPLQAIFGKAIYPFVYAIGSRPGFRKTDLLINMAVEFEAVGKYGMIFSFEDSKETFRNKYIAIRSKLPKQTIMDMELSKQEIAKIREETGDKEQNRIFFYDKALNLRQFRAIVDEQMKLRNMDYILLDYLQLFKTGRGKRHEEIGQITKEFMRIAQEYKLPIIFTSQVNERDEQKKGRVKLDLGDFKESGDIEADVRFAALIEGDRADTEKTINVAKNTWGVCKRVNIQFDGPSGFVTSWSEYE